MSHRLFVFGSNGEGQLGIPVADVVSSPAEVLTSLPLAELRAVRGGTNHTLLVTSTGVIYGAGDNRKGQLAPELEGEERLDSFQKLVGNIAFAAATCESTAYITIGEEPGQSQLFIQGSGQWGETGHDHKSPAELLVAGEPWPFLGSLPGTVIDFAAGVWHYIAVLEDGSVYGWGKARLRQLGEGLTGKIITPTRIEGIPFKPVRAVCGKDFTYLVGDPSVGEHIVLGQNKFNIVTGAPADIKSWKSIGAAWHAIFVLIDDGRLIAWGRNAMWQLIPPNLPLIDKIAVGSEHVLAVTKDGKLISWGWGKHGNCGDLSQIQGRIENDMVNGLWNEIELPGTIDYIGAGFCTSFITIYPK
ncbi:regulator of chromosome condensation 1/beta-lactamase-inhibitor protein II [Paraphoma chrysanthemicola]|uniref:Regulator of chromosome condensation 1/beta-lactamase-inhibitor protein II n=1 Tax=Paraphoma chrysanthemicola TaxID=798071 RepID=A0A8K0R7X7_9PLEO|nr:regulator of chromosome condensation 1/beta-lactamase-inhibitor protein II [Paraphoma chrysanthemicola]